MSMGDIWWNKTITIRWWALIAFGAVLGFVAGKLI